MPVGLLGEHRNVIAGSDAATTRFTSSTSSERSAARPPIAVDMPVTDAIWSCIRYVGSKIAQVRPAPPYARHSVWMTSFEPLATKT